MKVCDVLKPAKFATVSRAFHQNQGRRSAGWCLDRTVKVKEIKKQYSIQLGTIGMETICHMGATHCVLKRKKGPMLKKNNKKTKRRDLFGWKKKIKVHNLFCQTRTKYRYHRITHTDKYSALRANYNDVKKLQCLQPIDHLSCPPWPFTKM